MHGFNTQRGAVLVVSMIVLLVLTLIGVSAARTVLLEEKMTFASRDAKVALEVAEALVKQGEQTVEGLSTTGDFGTTGWLRMEGSGPDSMLDPATWTDANSREFSVTMDGKTISGRMYIELSGNAEKEDPADSITVGGYGQSTGGREVEVFRIVARGVGISGSTNGTSRILVTHYGKRF